MGVNKLIKFATLEDDINNFDTLTDDELVSLTEKEGIRFGAVARTNILNGIFRQVTKTNKVFGDLVANNYGSTITVETANTDAVYEGYMKKAIENIAKGVTVTLASAISFAGTRSGVTVNSQGLVTNVVALTLNDLPTIAQYTYIGRTTAGTGTPSAITRDNLLGITTNGFIKRTGANTYTHDATVYAPLSNVSLKKSGSPIDPTFWVGTQAQYDLLTILPEDETVYIIK